MLKIKKQSIPTDEEVARKQLKFIFYRLGESNFMLGDAYITYKIPVKSYAVILSNDSYSPNRDFVFPILFDDTGNWQCRYMGYAWYVFS